MLGEAFSNIESQSPRLKASMTARTISTFACAIAPYEVTAPSEAEDTTAAYFAMTPRL
jgi:hypothetical protein